MNKKTTSEKKSIWQWLQALIRILQMLAWWNTNKNKKAPTPDPSPERWRGVMNTDRVDRMDPVLDSTANKDRVDPVRDSRLNTDRADIMDPMLDSTANKDRMDPATTDTCKNSPPREGAGEAVQEMSGEAATLIAQPVSVISGPQSSTQLSRFQLLSSLRSDCRALTGTPNDGDGKQSGSPLKGGRGGLRKIDYLVLHCSDTRPDQDFTIEKLKACHKTRGFGDYPGYHVYVRRDGSVYYCRPVRLKGCHVKGHNSDSIGICYEGGHAPQGSLHKYEDNRTQAQKEALREVFAVLHDCFPNARIVGHNEFGVPKACPCLSKESMEEFRQEIIHWRE